MLVKKKKDNDWHNASDLTHHLEEEKSAMTHASEEQHTIN